MLLEDNQPYIPLHTGFIYTKFMGKQRLDTTNMFSDHASAILLSLSSTCMWLPTSLRRIQASAVYMGHKTLRTKMADSSKRQTCLT